MFSPEDYRKNEKREIYEPILLYTESFLYLPIEARLLFLYLYVKCDKQGLVIAPKATARAAKIDEKFVDLLVKEKCLLQGDYDEYYIPNIFVNYSENDPWGWDKN